MGDLTKISEIMGNVSGNRNSEKPVIPEIANEDPEISALRAKISEMEKQHAKEVNNLKCENVIGLEIYRSGAKNVRAVRGLIALPEPLELDEGGNVKGLSEAIAALKKSDGYLFEDEKNVKFSGAVPAESSGELPDFSRMTYSQISEFLAKNPQFSVN